MTKEMLAIARKQRNLEAEGEAYLSLYKFRYSLNYTPLALKDMEQALNIFQRIGDQRKVVKIKALKLKEGAHFRKYEEIIPEMEALLKQAQALNDTIVIYDLHSSLIGLYHGLDRDTQALNHIEALEAITPEVPQPYKTCWIFIYTARMRAWIAENNKDYEAAEHHLHKALQYAEIEPSSWYISDLLMSLFSVKRKEGDLSTAKAYLDKAHLKAEEIKSDDLLKRIFKYKSEVAEAEGRFEAALIYKKKELLQDEIIKNKNPGFNVQSFYAEMEKDKVAAEKASQEIELQLKETQLRSYLAIVVLALLLAAGFIYAYYLQRRAKERLAKQNNTIQKQAEVLQNLDAAKSRFFANVSHELRTPLTLLLGPINSVIKEDSLSEKQQKLLLTAKLSGENLQKLVTQILDLTKLEAGKMEINEQATELLAFFQKELVQFESLAFSKEIDISFKIALEEGLMANIDQIKYRQIIHNLLSNALKFTPGGGQVKVSLAIENDKLLLDVADTGDGIHPADLPHLFNRYFQTNQSGKPIEGGTGIGLAICHEYTQLFGGKISVESELGKGSIFHLEMPITPLPETAHSVVVSSNPVAQLDQNPPIDQKYNRHLGSQPATDSAPPADSSEPKPTILVVEDQPELQAYIRYILEEKYHVLTAGNGKIALEKLTAKGKPQRDEQSTPDLILSDLMMPVMDGYQLLEKLKSNDATRHVPVIMLTARADVRDKLKALRLGVDDYLLKPFDEEELLVRIENLLKHQAGRKEFIAANEAEKASVFLSETDRKWLETFEAYTKKNLSSDTLNIPRLAMEFAMSESTLLRQLKRLTGLSPVAYLQEMRLNEARHLLENRQYDSIARVASKVGYSDLNHFGRSFKQRFGKTPSDLFSN